MIFENKFVSEKLDINEVVNNFREFYEMGIEGVVAVHPFVLVNRHNDVAIELVNMSKSAVRVRTGEVEFGEMLTKLEDGSTANVFQVLGNRVVTISANCAVRIGDIYAPYIDPYSIRRMIANYFAIITLDGVEVQTTPCFCIVKEFSLSEQMHPQSER